MQCVVPLAGPQLTHPRHGLIPKYPVDGAPLLRRTLETRPWWRTGRLGAGDLTFVLREGQELAELREAVSGWFPGCRTVVLSHLTKGAVLSALAGAAAVSALNEPLIVDLADILYDAEIDAENGFASDRSLGMLVPYFEANDPCYSYLALADDGLVASAAEKRVISTHASAGTYLFRTAGHFIAAAGRSLTETPGELEVGGALFVCPVLNSIVRQGLRAAPFAVRDVRSVSKLLHSG
jgi:hypothetical protein